MTDALSTDTAPQKVKPILRGNINFFESRHNHWSCVPPRGTTKEQLLLSSLWCVVSDRMQPFDLITCIAEDRSYYAQLLVVDAGRGHASMQLLHYFPMEALLVTEAGLPSGFEVFFAGPVSSGNGMGGAGTSGGYCVKRTSDNVLICQGYSNRDDAVADLLRHASLR